MIFRQINDMQSLPFGRGRAALDRLDAHQAKREVRDGNPDEQPGMHAAHGRAG